MKNLMNKIRTVLRTVKDKTNSTMTRAYLRVMALSADAQLRLQSQSGEFVVNHGVVFLIILVLAALAITALTGLMNDTLVPTVRQKMLDFFN